MSQQQASTPVSPLRRRMLDDMAMRGLHEDTQRNYIMSVRNFAAFLGRTPETATPEDVRRFQIHQADSGVQAPTLNNAVSGLLKDTVSEVLTGLTALVRTAADGAGSAAPAWQSTISSQCRTSPTLPDSKPRWLSSAPR